VRSAGFGVMKVPAMPSPLRVRGTRYSTADTSHGPDLRRAPPHGRPVRVADPGRRRRGPRGMSWAACGAPGATVVPRRWGGSPSNAFSLHGTERSSIPDRETGLLRARESPAGWLLAGEAASDVTPP